jgi:hypothetical protein
MGEVNYYNIHEYIDYKITEHLNTVFIYWDTSNEQIHNLMLNENLLFKKEDTINCLWVNQIRRVVKWKQGSVCYLFATLNYQKTMLVVFSLDPTDIHRNICVMINEDGYLMKKKDISSDEIIFERVNCVYNDLLDEEYNPYVLK